jgi:hypothetical protein
MGLPNLYCELLYDRAAMNCKNFNSLVVLCVCKVCIKTFLKVKFSQSCAEIEHGSVTEKYNKEVQ